MNQGKIIKLSLVVSLICHIICISLFSFSLEPAKSVNDLYRLSFLGSILKEADFFVAGEPPGAAQYQSFSANILLQNHSKGITLYNRGLDKPQASIEGLVFDKGYRVDTYRRIESTIEQSKNIKDIEIPLADWQKVKLEMSR